MALGLAGLVAAGTKTGPKQARLLFVAGLSLGFAYLVREFVVLAYPIAVTAGLWAGLRLRQLMIAGAGALTCLAVDMANGAFVYGNPFARLTTAGHGGTPYADEPVTHLTAFAKIITALEPSPLSTGFLLLIGLLVVSSLVARDPRLWILSGWFLSFYLPFSLLSGGLNPNASHFGLR